MICVHTTPIGTQRKADLRIPAQAEHVGSRISVRCKTGYQSEEGYERYSISIRQQRRAQPNGKGRNGKSMANSTH